jgi:hypothetical protein
VFFFGIPECHPVVVLGGEHSISGTAFIDQRGPSFRIIGLSMETSELVHVVFPGDFPVMEAPAFIDAFNGIDTPMDENAELGVCEPLHLGVQLIIGSLRVCKLNYEYGKEQQRMMEISHNKL